MRRTTLLACLALGACAVHDDEPDTFRIAPICIEDDAQIPEGAWACSEPLVVDCNDGSVPDEIYVAVDDGTCDGLDLQEVPGPFPPGEYEIVVVDADSDNAICTTELTVTDTLPPVIAAYDVPLWPPNHKYHDIALADCMDVLDCDENWTAVIDYVSSDEPDDDNGDGHTDADIVLAAPDVVSLRSERQGGGNGRVYTIGFTVTDGSDNATEGSCRVIVSHDQGKKDDGADIDDGEAYRVEPD